MKTDLLDRDRITVASDFLPLLRANGLETFEQVMALAGGKVARDFPGRRTVRLELRAPDGSLTGIYLKRYETDYVSVGQRFLRLIRWPGAADEAFQEWQALQAVSAIGVPTATPIAVGQQRSGGAVTRSFLMTAEISGAVEGHVFMQALSPVERRQFLIRVAEMARRFHAAGLVHKDFYLGHVLAVRGAAGAEFFLIDLQRVVKPCYSRSRGVRKDLSALAYSAWNFGASRTDILRAFLTYTGRARLDDASRRLARKVLPRVAWLLTRQPKHDAPLKQRR